MSNELKEMNGRLDIAKAVMPFSGNLFMQAWEGWGDNGKQNSAGAMNPFLGIFAKPMQELLHQQQEELTNALKIQLYPPNR